MRTPWGVGGRRWPAPPRIRPRWSCAEIGCGTAPTASGPRTRMWRATSRPTIAQVIAICHGTRAGHRLPCSPISGRATATAACPVVPSTRSSSSTSCTRCRPARRSWPSGHARLKPGGLLITKTPARGPGFPSGRGPGARLFGTAHAAALPPSTRPRTRRIAARFRIAARATFPTPPPACDRPAVLARQGSSALALLRSEISPGEGPQGPGAEPHLARSPKPNLSSMGAHLHRRRQYTAPRSDAHIDPWAPSTGGSPPMGHRQTTARPAIARYSRTKPPPGWSRTGWATSLQTRATGPHRTAKPP